MVNLVTLNMRLVKNDSVYAVYAKGILITCSTRRDEVTARIESDGRRVVIYVCDTMCSV